MKKRNNLKMELLQKSLKQIRKRLLDIREKMPTDDEVFLIQFDKELIRAIDALDSLLFLSKKWLPSAMLDG